MWGAGEWDYGEQENGLVFCEVQEHGLEDCGEQEHGLVDLGCRRLSLWIWGAGEHSGGRYLGTRTTVSGSVWSSLEEGIPR